MFDFPSSFVSLRHTHALSDVISLRTFILPSLFTAERSLQQPRKKAESADCLQSVRSEEATRENKKQRNKWKAKEKERKKERKRRA